ncbi:MAG: carboxypeptidase-like regulatory domain-containing protein, partial [Bryobacteraceae bacterium]
MNRLFFAVLLAASAFAQTANVTGKIADQTGAAIPGADVAITHVDTGALRRTVSNELGLYAVPALPPGRYKVDIRKSGMKSITQDNVTLIVGQVARLDFTMEVGGVNESVEVTAAAPILDQETSSLGQLIDSAKIASIPLNGRSTFRLVHLTPGLISAPSAGGQFGDIPVNTTWDTNFSINGGRSQSNEVQIDGVPATSGFFNQITTIPSVEATQEFKVQSNSLSAEWGRFSGGVINVSTRSGTNEFHGALYEFLRNNAFDANDFFNNRAGKNIPPFRMNQFGGAIGGPVELGKLYHGR